MDVEFCADVDATKADSDKKSYRLIKLQNGLRVLLVHDPPSAGSKGCEFHFELPENVETAVLK